MKKWLHDWLGWGFPQEKISVNGIYDIYPRYTCRFCEDELSQDSQGNWFHL